MSAGSLLPACLELAGVEIPEATAFPSLASVLQRTPAVAAPVFSEIDFGIWDYRHGDR